LPLEENERFPDPVGLCFSPDGALFVWRAEYVVNLTAWAWWWPETSAVLLGLVAWALAFRVARDRRTPGEPHCRGCGYPTRGLPEKSRCPECGLRLSPENRVVPRSKSLRLIAPVLAGLLSALAAGTPDEVRRSAAEAVAWRAGWAYRWKELSELLPQDWRQCVRRLTRMDPGTGEVRHLFDGCPAIAFNDFTPAEVIVLPGGRTVVVRTSPDIFLEVSATDGRLIREVRFRESMPDGPGWDGYGLHLSLDGTLLALFPAYANGIAGVTALLAWRASDLSPVDPTGLDGERFEREWAEAPVRSDPNMPEVYALGPSGRETGGRLAVRGIYRPMDEESLMAVVDAATGRVEDCFRVKDPVFDEAALSHDGRYVAVVHGRDVPPVGFSSAGPGVAAYRRVAVYRVADRPGKP
jgi:hypothetical protein